MNKSGQRAPNPTFPAPTERCEHTPTNGGGGVQDEHQRRDGFLLPVHSTRAPVQKFPSQPIPHLSRAYGPPKPPNTPSQKAKAD